MKMTQEDEKCDVIAIKADVVDPVGLYANWSNTWSVGKAGSKYLRTMSRSVTRDIIGVQI